MGIPSHPAYIAHTEENGLILDTLEFEKSYQRIMLFFLPHYIETVWEPWKTDLVEEDEGKQKREKSPSVGLIKLKNTQAKAWM